MSKRRSRTEKIPTHEEQRMTESRWLLKEGMAIAFGVYVENEATKKDTWRDQSWGELYAHAKHEMEEIRRSNSPTMQLHNACDLLMLAAMLVRKAMGDG